MAYTVIWDGKEGVLEKAPFQDEASAKSYAVAVFPARKMDYGVVAAEVWDDSGKVVFRYPNGQ